MSMDSPQKTYLSKLMVDTRSVEPAGSLHCSVSRDIPELCHPSASSDNGRFSSMTSLPPPSDVFLCPFMEGETFTPRFFSTPEEEEAWWSDPMTWPGDHLITSSNDTLRLMPAVDRPSYAFTTCDGNGMLDPMIDTGVESNPTLPEAPLPHTPPCPSRRRVSRFVPYHPAQNSPKKSQRRRSKDSLSVVPKESFPRRKFLELPAHDHGRIRDERIMLRDSKRTAPPFQIKRPVQEGERGNRHWRCQYEQGGERCTMSSRRKTEGYRHTLTHSDVRFLCGNVECRLAFSREDAAKRHMLSSKCNQLLPPGITASSPKDAVLVEGPSFRLVQLEWQG